MSYEQRLWNLGIPDNLPDEEIERRLAIIMVRLEGELAVAQAEFDRKMAARKAKDVTP